MMKNMLKSKAGVTVLEGVIALGLLSLVMAGAFGVLLATSRQNMQPDIYEEMMLAVEKANDRLKSYTPEMIADAFLEGKAQAHRPAEERGCICGSGSGCNLRNLDCLLPPLCNMDSSKFEFSVVSADRVQGNWSNQVSNSTAIKWEGKSNPQLFQDGGDGEKISRDNTDYTNPTYNPSLQVQFHIECNGYQL